MSLLKLLSEGVYSYVLHDLEKVVPVHPESMRKFVHSVLKYCEWGKLEEAEVNWERVFGVVYGGSGGKGEKGDRVLGKVRAVKEEVVKDAIRERVSEVLEIVVQKNFDELSKHAKKQYLGFLEAGFKFGIVPVEDFGELFLKEKNYEDVHCLEEFNEEMAAAAKREKEALEP